MLNGECLRHIPEGDLRLTVDDCEHLYGANNPWGCSYFCKSLLDKDLGKMSIEVFQQVLENTIVNPCRIRTYGASPSNG